MYINNENNKPYPNMVNDYDKDINCEKLFDSCYEIYNNYNKHIEDIEAKNGLTRIQAVDTTNYERDNFISLIEHQASLLNKDNYVSSSKFIGYVANMLVYCFNPKLFSDHNSLSKSKMQQEFNAAVKIITNNAKNERKRDSSNINAHDNNTYVNNYRNEYNENAQQMKSSNNVVWQDNNRQTFENQVLDFQPIVGGHFINRKSKYNIGTETNNHYYNKNDYERNRGSYHKNNSSNLNGRSSQSKRKVNGVNKSKKLLYRGIAISALVASLTVGGINHTIANRNLINNTTYQVAQDNSISPSMYLSNSGDKNSLLYSPMFGSDGFKKSNMFSDKNKFDVSILKLYEEYGNYGISEYISKKLNSGEMLSINDMKNLAKANKVFSLSVMQDELINSLGNKKNDKVRYACFSKVKLDPEELISEGDHIILFYDQYGYKVDKTYYADKYISQYIKNSENYFSQIDEKFDDINKNIEKNSNYEKSVNCYRDLIEINDIVSKSFGETNTLAMRNHVKHFSLPDSRIVTKGVHLDFSKDVNKMKMNLNYDKDDDERDDR